MGEGLSQQMQLASQFNRPTKMVRVIALSPLARIFQPRVNIEPYLDEPNLWKEQLDPFDVVIEGAHATVAYKTGEVHLIDENLAYAYVGHDNTRFSQGYGHTGLIYFNVSDDLTASLDYNLKTGRPLPKDLKAQLEDALKEYKELSHKRVIEHAKRLYNSLVAGRNALRQDGKEPPPPNDMEMLIAFILKDEVARTKARRAKLQKAFDETAKDIGEDIENILG